MAAWSPPGRSVRPIEPAKSTSPDRHHVGGSSHVRRAAGTCTDPRCGPGAWSTVDLEPGELQHRAVGERHDVVGLGPGQPAAEQLPQLAARGPLERVGQPVAVVAGWM